MQLSPDGRWFWDGEQWRTAVSPDGRWRWDGRRWVPAAPPPSAWRYEPTEWTRRLQIILLALMAAGIVVDVLMVPTFVVPMFQHAIDRQLAQRPADPRVDPEQLRSFIYGFLWSVLAVTGAAVVIMEAVLAVGILRLWRWVYWYFVVVYLLSILAIPQDVAYAAGLGLYRLPAWIAAVLLPLSLVHAATGAWMIVLYRRYGTWARRRVPA